MKRMSICLALVLLTAGVALADETVNIPFWQHGYGVKTFFQVVNMNDTNGDDITVTIQLLTGSGSVSTSDTITPGSIWCPTTAYWDPDNWYWTQLGNNAWGTGRIIIESDADSALIYGVADGYGMLYDMLLPEPNQLYGSGS